MKTVIFINDEIRELKKEYEFIFTPLLNNDVVFCNWNSDEDEEFKIFPELYNLILEDIDWRAIILFNNDLNTLNPYDKNQELIKISQFLGGIHPDREYNFIYDHGKRKIDEKIINKSKYLELKEKTFLSVKKPLEIIFITPTKNKHYLSKDAIDAFFQKKDYSPNSKFIIYPFSLSKKMDKLNWFKYFSCVLLLSIQLFDNNIFKSGGLYYATIHLDFDAISHSLNKYIKELEKRKKEVDIQIENLNKVDKFSVDEIFNESVDNDIPVSPVDIKINWSFLDYLKLNKFNWESSVRLIKNKINNIYDQKMPFLQNSNAIVRERLKNLKTDYKLDKKSEKEMQTRMDEIIQDMYQHYTVKCIPKEEMFYAINLEDNKCKCANKTKIEKRHLLVVGFIYIVSVLASFFNVFYEALFFIKDTIVITFILLVVLFINISMIYSYIIKNYIDISKYIKRFVDLVDLIAKTFIDEFNNYNNFQDNLLNYIKGQKILEYNKTNDHETENNYILNELLTEKKLLEEYIDYYCLLDQMINLKNNESCFNIDITESIDMSHVFERIKLNEYSEILLNNRYTLFSPYDYISDLIIKEHEGDEDDRVII